MSKKKERIIPKYAVGPIETHCHLDYLKGQELIDTLEKCQEYGVNKVVTIAVSPDNLKKVRELTANEIVYGTQGIHPHEAKHITQDTYQEIEESLTNPKIVAVGEIGLDYYYEYSDPTIQKEAFEKQLQIACDNDLPVVIHTREADEDTKAILKNFSTTLKRKGVIHSFTSGIELAEFCLSEGFHIGFNGIVTFKNAGNVRDVLDIVPIEQMLLETDSPYLTPVPFRGRENAPFYLPCVADFIATHKEIDAQKLIDVANSNAENLFFKLK
ncbi:TatD family hydrolase [Halobacteriovorax sp. HFRX-2_2]|uniref:TatD family hydrolase n=1 Tax=unclassified Halobacteriovorax TaxID=2639665 RepID=UPI00371596C4